MHGDRFVPSTHDHYGVYRFITILLINPLRLCPMLTYNQGGPFGPLFRAQKEVCLDGHENSIRERRRSVISLPYLVALLATLAVSAASVIFQYATAEPLIVAFYRLGFSTLILGGMIPFLRTAGFTRRDLQLTVLSGVFLAAHFAFWFFSLTLTSIASSTVLVNTHPFVILVFEYLVLARRISAQALFGVVVAVTGAMLVGWGDFRLDAAGLLGDLLAFLGAVAFAGYLLLGRETRKRISAVHYSFVAYLSATAVLGTAGLVWGNNFSGFPIHNWAVFVALAVIPTMFGHTLFNWALRFLPASVVSVSVLGEPVGATLLAWVLFQTLPSSLGLTGGLLILFGLAIFLLWHRDSYKVGA
jgi:drug/metabolite transporter (DMT)-like permease